MERTETTPLRYGISQTISVYLCFFNYNNEFDQVNYDRLVKLLKEKIIDQLDISLINKQFNQEIMIRFEDKSTNDVNIKRGLRKGCILCLLYHMYAEQFFQKVLKEEGPRSNPRVSIA